jgi:predicted phosphodiesterase
MTLARAYLRLFFGPEIDTENVKHQRAAAENILRTGNVDVVVMGHSHHAERTPLAGGTYLNTGCWYTHRTFGVLDKNGPALFVWQNNPAAPFVEWRPDVLAEESE